MRCLFREKKILCGKYTEVEIYPVYKQPRGRSRKAHPSSETQLRQNDRNKRRKLTRLLNTNFSEHDFEIHLTYTDENLPDSYEAAIKAARNYIRRCRKLYKAAGTELRYIIVTEKGKHARYHHHITISGGVSRDDLERAWHAGRSNCRRLQPDENGLAALAEYISKETTGKRGWIGSKNLKKPVEKIADHKISRKKAEQIEAAGEDWTAVRALYSAYQVIKVEPVRNEINGELYISIFLRRAENAKKQKHRNE